MSNLKKVRGKWYFKYATYYPGMIAYIDPSSIQRVEIDLPRNAKLEKVLEKAKEMFSEIEKQKIPKNNERWFLRMNDVFFAIEEISI